jgi:hypothetical protein
MNVSRIPQTALMVLAYIRDVNPEPTYLDLMFDCDLSALTVCRCIRHLEQTGALLVVRGRGVRNRYFPPDSAYGQLVRCMKGQGGRV